MKQRIITGFLGGATFLFFTFLGGFSFALFIYLLALIAYFEFLRMAKIPFLSLGSFVGFLMLGIILVRPHFSSSFFVDLERMMVCFLIIFLALMVLTKNKLSMEHVGSLFLGVLYIGFGFMFFIKARHIYGFELVLFILISIWATDTGAYFIGRKFGKHKLWPAISPNKTKEGSLGGILSALFMSLIFIGVFGLWESWVYFLGTAFIISIFGQLGDLVESALKRHYQVKDSGRLLPGHGGVLDRFDSILFVFPVLHILQLI